MEVIPFDKITQFGQQTMLDRPLFNVSWILGRFCNYKCSYCWPYARSDQQDFLPLETYISTIDNIKSQANANGFDQFHWSFSGGEPTTYRHLLDIVKHLESDLKSSYQSIHMTTNLSPGSKWWKNWCSVVAPLQRKSITASYHAEFAKEQEFGDKCLQLMYEGVFVTVNQVMVPEQFNELYDRCMRLRSRGINVTLKPQSDLTASSIVSGYTDDMIRIMKEDFQQEAEGTPLQQIRLTDGVNNYYIDQAERFNALGFNQFRGWNCTAGYQSIVINGNDVKRAHSCREQQLGTISDGFALFNAATPCVTDRCVSSADSKLPKHK